MDTLTRRPTKITFGEMRDTGVRGILIYCQDFHCSHSIAISEDQWPDHIRLSDLEARFVCKGCGKRGADIRPDFHGRDAGSGDGLSITAAPVLAIGVRVRHTMHTNSPRC